MNLNLDFEPLLLVDTREKDTPLLRERLVGIGWPYRREKLYVGDYTMECTLPDGRTYSLANRVSVERKANLEETIISFTGERARMYDEIWRAKNQGIRLYLVIENASWGKISRGEYKSRMHPKALEGTLRSVERTGGVILVFTRDSNETAARIREILFGEMVAYLSN